MNDEQYLQHNRQLLTDFSRALGQRTAILAEDDSLRALAGEFQALIDDKDADLYQQAVPLISRLFTTYPDFAPTFPRDLLWFFGGDCLHFMPDEEIELHRQLDEARHQAAASGEIVDFQAVRAKLLNLQ